MMNGGREGIMREKKNGAGRGWVSFIVSWTLNSECECIPKQLFWKNNFMFWIKCSERYFYIWKYILKYYSYKSKYEGKFWNVFWKLFLDLENTF